MMNISRFFTFLLILITTAGFSSLAQADLNITITRGAVGATPIAIIPFAWHGRGQPPAKIAGIVANDLLRTGLFAPLPVGRLPQKPTRPGNIRFNQWTSIGVSDLVIGSLRGISPGQFKIRFQLFDTLQGEQILGYAFQVKTQQLRHAAHRISDLVYQQLTGQRGVFTTHIAYIQTQVRGGRIIKYQLVVADYDGHNPQVIFASSRPLAMPAWSPDGRYIAYVGYRTGTPAIYIQNLKTGQRKMVSDQPGLNSAPIFSPDGQNLAMTLTQDGSAEIFILDLKTHQLTQFTFASAINTGAAWIPNGKAIVFTSDRGGSPQIYIKYLSGGTAQRLTFDGHYNAGPTVSPNGNLIAFVHSGRSGFRIGLLNLQTGQPRILTDGPLDGSPSFAPNGTIILYSTYYQGKSVLATVSVGGRVKERMSGVENIGQPAWGPFSQQSVQ